MRGRARLTASVILITATLLPDPALAPARAEATAPPDAWLFGSWIGGLFPAPTGVTAETCLAQPVVIFTRDLVLRASMTERTYSQRIVAAVRRTDDGFELLLDPAGGSEAASMASALGLPPPQQAEGFGCESADKLQVQRKGENEITFPGCSDFPNPLVRCPGR